MSAPLTLKEIFESLASAHSALAEYFAGLATTAPAPIATPKVPAIAVDPAIAAAAAARLAEDAAAVKAAEEAKAASQKAIDDAQAVLDAAKKAVETPITPAVPAAPVTPTTTTPANMPECFTWYDPKDTACTKDCADNRACRIATIAAGRLTEATPATPASSTLPPSTVSEVVAAPAVAAAVVLTPEDEKALEGLDAQNRQFVLEYASAEKKSITETRAQLGL